MEISLIFFFNSQQSNMKISLVCCFMLIFALNCNAEIFHESRKVPYGWYEITDQPLHPMTLTFALKQRNTDILEVKE